MGQWQRPAGRAHSLQHLPGKLKGSVWQRDIHLSIICLIILQFPFKECFNDLLWWLKALKALHGNIPTSVQPTKPNWVSDQSGSVYIRNRVKWESCISLSHFTALFITWHSHHVLQRDLRHHEARHVRHLVRAIQFSQFSYKYLLSLPRGTEFVCIAIAIPLMVPR